MADVLSIEKLLNEDIERIYLGNLKTVEADVEMPLQGNNGSVFSWESEKPYLFSPEGKVTRPHFGAGNREVKLTLTATLDGVTATKVYVANVLEKEYPTTVVSAYPITIYTEPGKKPHLPGIAVIRNNLGEDAVIPVEWPQLCECKLASEGEFTVEGSVKDNVKVLLTVVVTTDKEKLCPVLDMEKKAELFAIKDVNLTEGSGFYAQQQRVLENLLNTCDDSMLYNFRVAAGLDTKGAEPMTGWDAPEGNLRGHTSGHYLSGLALSYAATKNAGIKKKLDYMIDSLAEVQDAMATQDKFAEGFISAYDETQFDLLEEYTTYPTIWAPYYTLHKILAGLRDCYELGENPKALEILKKVGLWVYNRLSRLPREQRDRMWAMYIAGEFGGINETMADLYMLTKDERYLEASRYFDNDKLYLPMKMGIDALGNLHANQHIPQIIGVMRQFDATKEKERYDIANNFWNFVTSEHIYSIGGVGETEMFKPAREIAKFVSDKTAESCATYNMLKLTGQLYQYTPCAGYMNYYETAVTNHINACGDIGGPTGGSTYFMPTNPGAQKHFDHTENSCCHGTGLENHFKYGEYIYAKTDDAVVVNLFIPNRLTAAEDVVEITAKAETESYNVTISVEKLSKETLKVRKPLWAESVKVAVNGTEVTPCECEGYYVFNLTEGTVAFEFGAKGYLSTCVDDAKTASICWGPYVLAAICDCHEYIEFDVTEETLKEKLVHKGDLEFELCGHRFMPLAKVNQEHYHVYIKIK
ncbi:MAG: glycoside hydrolase family 127 protein [Oscillospiraceae bacterium]|nr:glycoside hydrolase family 127 protein [Oscillospiraceae bacterium]